MSFLTHPFLHWSDSVFVFVSVVQQLPTTVASMSLRTKTLLSTSLCVFVFFFFGTVVQSGDAKGMWGTGTRRKRAAEREFTLPNHMVQDSALTATTAKSFEELQAEAMAEQAEVSAEGFYADQLLNTLNKPTSKKKENSKKNKQRKGIEGGNEERSSNDIEEIEHFLNTVFDKLEVLLNSPNFGKKVEEFAIKVLSSHFTTIDTDAISSLFQENTVLESTIELRKYLVVLKQLSPTLATSISRDLAPEDVRTLLSLDAEEEPLAIDLLDFTKRMLSKYSSLDMDQDLDVEGIMKIFSTLLQQTQEGIEAGAGRLDQFGSEALQSLLNKFLSTVEGGGGVQFGEEDVLHSLTDITEDILASPEKFMDDFRSQLREIPMLAEMAGISQAVINDDKKWSKFVKKLQSNLELLGTASGRTPDVADIFGVDNPQFASILKSIGTLEKDIEEMKSSPITKKSKSKRKDKTTSQQQISNDKNTKKNNKQTYQSTTAAL